MSRARVGLAVAVVALALDARAQTIGRPSPDGGGTTPPKAGPATPVLRGLQDAIGRRQATGLPVPTVSYSYEVSGGAAAARAGLMAAGSTEPVTLTARAVLQFDTPEQAGYLDGTWPQLQIRHAFPANPEIAAPEGDYSAAYRQYMEKKIPGIWERVPFGREPRTYTLTETVTIHPASGSSGEAARRALGAPATAADASVGNALMGFGLVDRVDWTIQDDLYVLGVEVYFFRAGFLLDFAFGLRLPAVAGLTGPTSIASGSSATYSASFSTRDWSAGEYEAHGLSGESGNEFVARESVFVGLDCRVFEVDKCGNQAHSDVDESSSFKPTFGPGSSFPQLRLKVPVYSRSIDILTFDVGVKAEATFHADRVNASTSVLGGSATASMPVSAWGTPEGAVDQFRVNACLAPGASRFAVVRLDDFKYWFDAFRLDLLIYAELAWDLPWWLGGDSDSIELPVPIATLDLDWLANNLSGGRALGGYRECDLTFSCPPVGSANQIERTVYVADVDAPTTDLEVRGTLGNEGWYRSDVSLGLRATDNPPGCGIGVAATQYALGGGWTAYEREVLVATEGQTPFSYRSWDHDMNTRAYGPVLLKIDKTAPVVSATLVPPPNAHGWNRGDVRVEFTAADPISGVATVTPPRTLSAEGAGQVVEGTATDHAGNVRSTTVAVNIDRTPPTLLVSTPQPIAYPNTVRFDVQWAASDALSGVLAESAALDGVPIPNGQPVDLTLFAPGTHVLRVSALDRAENLSEEEVAFEVTVDVDGLRAATDRVCVLGWIDKYGICVSLSAKLDAAKASIARGNVRSARGQLEAFLHELAAQWYKAVNQEAHDVLTAEALWVLEHLG